MGRRIRDRPLARTGQPFDEHQYRDIGRRVSAAVTTAIAAIPAAPEPTPEHEIVMVHNAAFVINNGTLGATAGTTTSSLLGTNGLPATGVVGVFVGYEVWCATGVSYLGMSPSDETPDSFGPYTITSSNHGAAGVFPVRLGPTGAIKVKAISGAVDNLYVWIVGYWT